MLVDDHQVVRDGIKLLLADTEDVVVCAEASSAREAVAARPQTSVLTLTSFADDEALFASGILAKLEVARRAEAAAYLARHHGQL
jgi:DNA-binding NarL/FixJ family response regulator